MYELLFIQRQTLKNRGSSTLVTTGESYEQLFEVMKSKLTKRGVFAPYFRVITKEDATVIDYGSDTSKYIIKKA